MNHPHPLPVAQPLRLFITCSLAQIWIHFSQKLRILIFHLRFHRNRRHRTQNPMVRCLPVRWAPAELQTIHPTLALLRREGTAHLKGRFWLVVEPTHLKNMFVKMGSSSPNRDENLVFENHHLGFCCFSCVCVCLSPSVFVKEILKLTKSCF